MIQYCMYIYNSDVKHRSEALSDILQGLFIESQASKSCKILGTYFSVYQNFEERSSKYIVGSVPLQNPKKFFLSI